jgi:hypothetical protein
MKFTDWWETEGSFIDPDTSDVPWFDKRKSLCQAAFDAASTSKLAEARLETIKAMSGYLDDVAEALGVPKPGTPVEGVGACWKVMEAIQTLQTDQIIMKSGIETAINRLEEINYRDGGTLWHKAKDILGADLYLVLTGLQTTKKSAESV